MAQISISKKYDHIVLTFKGNLKKDISSELQVIWEDIQVNEVYRACIADFTSAENIDDGALTEFILGARKLKSRNIKLYFVNTNNTIQKKVIKGGLDRSLILKDSLDEALVDAGLKSKPKLKVNVDFLNPFIQGAIKTLKLHAKLESEAGTPFLKTTQTTMQIDIFAILGIVSTAFNGSIALCFSKDLFLNVVNNMLGENYAEINDENEDAAAELLSIMFGAAKETLNQKDYGIKQAIPTVIRGTSLLMKNVIQEPTIVIPLKTPQGPYEIHIGIISTS